VGTNAKFTLLRSSKKPYGISCIKSHFLNESLIFRDFYFVYNNLKIAERESFISREHPVKKSSIRWFINIIVILERITRNQSNNKLLIMIERRIPSLTIIPSLNWIDRFLAARPWQEGTLNLWCTSLKK